MSIRVKRWPSSKVESTTFDVDTTREQRETTVDGQTFHWAVNEVRNFLDRDWETTQTAS